MKKAIIITLIMFCSISMSAQRQIGATSHPAQVTNNHTQPQFDAKKFESDLEAYVVREAGINSGERVQFLRVYREKRRKENAIMEKLRAARQKEPRSERDWEQAIKNRDKLELQLKQTQQTYHNSLLHIIKASKMAKVITAEERFQREAFGHMYNQGQPVNNGDPKRQFGY